VSNYTGAGISQPTAITAGRDGGMWFINSGNVSFGRIQALRTDAATMVAPVNGGFVGNGTFLVAAGGTGVNAMEFRVTGGSFHDTVVDEGADFGAFGWWGGWSTTAVAEGNYQIVAVGRDTNGNAGNSPPITVTVDHTAPNTSVSLPANNASVRGNIFLVAGASDNHKVDKVEYLVDNTVVSGSSLTAFGWLGGWNTTTIADGIHTLRSRATDAAGNMKVSGPVTITVDNTPPATSVLLPANNATVRGNVFVDASGTDNIKLATVEFLVDGTVVSGSGLTPFGWLGGWNTTTTANGTHLLRARATDTAGNVTLSPPITVTVQN
jgi:hypothetical protein